MITANQLFAHAIGDYVLQSDWMATEKTRKSLAALCHVTTYALPFLFLTRDPKKLVAIMVTHFVIDRWRLARFVVAFKNYLFSPDCLRMSFTSYWHGCNRATGYPPEKPDFFAWWLLIIADNILHVLSNGLALKYL